MKKTFTWVTILALLALAVPAAADDWEDPRRERLEDAVRDLEAAATALKHGTETTAEDRVSVVNLRHGKVQLVADLARVDVTLEIRNTSAAAIQWQRNFEMDPDAEAIGASLQRGTTRPIDAQTLTVAAAQRIYQEVITGPRRRTPRVRSRDPLRVERSQDRRLLVSVWPVAAGETVRVNLTFVTPLQGRGSVRTWRDVIQADRGGSTRPPQATPRPTVTPRPGPAVSAVAMSLDTDWVVHPGKLEVAGEPVGMVAAGRAGGALRYVGAVDGNIPTLPLRTPEPTADVLAVRGGGLGTRVAIWHFDPIRFVQDQDLEVPRGATLRLLKRGGSTSRIAPWTFRVTDDPKPVTARLLGTSETLRYAVEVRDASGKVLETIEMEREVRRERLSKDLEGAITGWHRAALVRRVLEWGRTANQRGWARALDFAVDLGVLVPGTAALAVPAGELRRVSPRSRRQYRQDGAPLGAQGHEADFQGPPPGSMKE